MLLFGQSGKLSPYFIRPFEILARIGEVAYCLALLPQLSDDLDVFSVSVLCKYQLDSSQVLCWTDAMLEQDVSYKEQQVRILETKERVLRGRTIVQVKILCKHH